jgi:hypothetical protein
MTNMTKMKLYLSREVAAMCGCSIETAVKYAQKPENSINFAGSGRRKIYIWFEEDIEHFRNRDTNRGRPPKEKPATPEKTAKTGKADKK